MKSILWLSCYLAFLAGPICAADFYVDVAHPKASDENPGTKELPWKTVQHAANSVDLGATVHVMPGVYPESVSIGPNVIEGETTRPRKGKGRITFIADGDGPAIIDGAAHLKPEDLKPTDEKGVFSWSPPQPFIRYGAGAAPQHLSWVFIGDTRLILKQYVYPELAFNARTGDDDIVKWKRFCSKLKKEGSKETPSPAKRVWSLLPARNHQMIENGLKEEFTDWHKYHLARALNSIITRNRDMYELEAFRKVRVPAEAEEVRKIPPTSLRGPSVYKFNRLVLEAAFPGVVAEAKLDAGPKLAVADILNWETLCGKLISGGSSEQPCPAKRIWSLLHKQARAFIEAAIGAQQRPFKLEDKQKQSITLHLQNVLARRADLYDEEHFEGVSLSPEALELCKIPPASLRGPKLALYNRLLLEAAFRKDIREKQPRLTQKETWSFVRGKDDILINFDGRGVPDGLDIQVSFRRCGFSVRDGRSRTGVLKAPGVHIKGFVLHRQIGQALAISPSTSCLVEDCNVIQPNMHGIVTGGGTAPHTFRRVRIYDSTMWGSNFFGNAHIIQENAFQSCGQRIDPAGEPWVGVLKSNGGSFQTIRHNLIIDRPPRKWKVGDRWTERGKYDFPFSGIWGDGSNMDNRVYGNCSARVPHAGIYVEHDMNRNLIMWNVIQDSGMGITFRCSSHNIVTQNWIFDSEALGIGEVDTDMMAGWGHEAEDHEWWGREILDGLCLWQTVISPGTMKNVVYKNLVQVSGRYISIPVPTRLDENAIRDAARIMCLKDDSVLRDKVAAKIDYSKAAHQSYQSPLNNDLNGNYYAMNRKPSKWNAGFALYLDKQLETFEEFQKATGLEETGRAGEFTPKDIGLQICWTIPPDTKFPDRPVAFDYDGGAERNAPRPSVGGKRFWADSTIEPYSWFRTSGELRDEATDRLRTWTKWPACRTGMRALGVVNLGKPESIPAAGKGWRTISLPVTPGTTMKVSVHAKAAEVTPAEGSQGIEVFAYFCDWTGHNAKREWLVGNGKRAELTRGTYDWTEVEQSIKVPDGVRRMTIYAGLKPATGSLLIDDLTMTLADPMPPSL